MRWWRLGTEALAAVLVSLAVLAVVAYAYRGDLRWLWAPPSENPPVARAHRPAPPPAPPASPAVRAAGPPPARVLSIEGLSIERYKGPLALDPHVESTLDVLDSGLMDAVKDLKDRSALFPTAGDVVTFVPVSARDCSFTEAFSATLDGGRVRVLLPFEPLVLKWWPARDVMSAGLAAGILLKEVPTFSAAPAWFRYGMSLYLSGFGDEYSKRAVLDSDRPPIRMIQPLGDATDTAWADGYWAIKALVSSRGDAAAKDWIEAMRAGFAWKEALRRATGESYESFESAYKTWATAYLSDQCANRRVLMSAVALLRQQKENEALPVLRKFVEDHPLDFYAGNARYFLNYARFRLGRYDRGIDGFTDLLVNAPYTTSWQGKAQYFLGRCYQLSGYGPLAVKHFELAALSPNDDLLVKLAKKRLKEIQ